MTANDLQPPTWNRKRSKWREFRQTLRNMRRYDTTYEDVTNVRQVQTVRTIAQNEKRKYWNGDSLQSTTEFIDNQFIRVWLRRVAPGESA